MWPQCTTRDGRQSSRAIGRQTARSISGEAAFEQTVAKVIGFVETPALGLDLPLDVRGTAFQQRVI
jgi:O6-methylguanine-DNA--protein-cysteine methyltransferase